MANRLAARGSRLPTRSAAISRNTPNFRVMVWVSSKAAPLQGLGPSRLLHAPKTTGNDASVGANPQGRAIFGRYRRCCDVVAVVSVGLPLSEQLRVRCPVPGVYLALLLLETIS